MTHSPTPRYLSTQFLSSLLSAIFSDLKLGLSVSQSRICISADFETLSRQACTPLDTGKERRDKDGVEGVVG